MKTINLKNIMSLAWQFFKQTGFSFSECLKKAWANFKLKKEIIGGKTKCLKRIVNKKARKSL